MRRSGQALVELAVFGSLMLMVLGAVVGRVLNADYQQQVQMESFRRAMNSAALSMANNRPISASHLVIQDRVIPDPSDPYAMGSIQPISANANSPTRSFKLGQAAQRGNEAELPRQLIEIQGKQFDCPSADRANAKLGFGPGDPNAPIHGCTTSGFRDVANVGGFKRDDNGEIINDPDSVGPIDRYDEVYGTTSIRPYGPLRGSRRNISIIDPVAGEIVAEEIGVRICRQMMLQDACRRECNRGKAPGTNVNCRAICRQSVQTPWYCDSSHCDDVHDRKCTSEAFENLFENNPTLGLQTTSQERSASIRHRAIIRQERPEGITTIEQVTRWHEDAAHSVAFREAANGNDPGDITEVEMLVPPKTIGDRPGDSRQTQWETPWPDKTP